MRKRFAIGLVAAAIVIVILVARRHELLRFAIARTIGLATGYHVEIADEHFGATHGAFLHVRVTKGADPVLEAERVDVWYSPRDLLPGSSHRFGLVGIAVDRPHLTIVRHADGDYNIRFPEGESPSLGAPAYPNTVPFRLTVRVRDASGELRAPNVTDPSARSIKVAGLNLDASIDTGGLTHYRLRGAFVEKRLAPFSAGGTVDIARGYAMHRLRATELPMRAIGNYLINSKAAHILGGTATALDARIYSLDVHPNQPIDYHIGARMSVADASFSVAGLALPIEHIRGVLQVVDGVLFVKRLDAMLAGIPLHGAGALFDFGNLQYKIGVSGRGDLAQLRHALNFAKEQPISGRADMGILIEGATDGPLLAIRADAPKAAYRGVAVERMHAEVAYYNSRLTFGPLEAHDGPALIGVRGTMDFGQVVKSHLVLHVRAPADRLPYAGELLGAEPLVIDALGIGTDLKFHVRGALASTAGVERAAALFGLEPDGEIDVAPVWIATPRGTLDAGYALDRANDTSAFWADARHLHLATPQHPAITSGVMAAIPAIDGRIDEARIAGGGPSGARAAFAGEVRAHDLTIAHVAVDRVAASFAGTLADASIDRIVASGPWGSLDGSGQFSTGSLIVGGAYRGTLQGLRPFLGNIDARGTAQGMASLAILPGKIVVQARNVRLVNASVRAIPITNVAGTVSIAGGIVRVLSAHAAVAGGDIVAAGAYSANVPPSQRLALVATGLDASHLRGIGLPLDAGRLSADGRLAPGASLPEFDGGVALARGRVQRYAVAGSGSIALAGTGVGISHLVGAVDGTYALVAGRVTNLTSGAPGYALRARLPAADIGRAFETLQLPSARSQGTFNADFAVTGRGLSPRVKGPVGVPAGSVNGLPFIDGRAQLTADRTGMVARRGSVVVGSTFATFAAAIRPHVSGLRVIAAQTDLSDFNNFFDTGDTLDGNGSLRFDIVSARHRISSNGDVNVREARFRNLPIGDTRAIWSSQRNTLRGSLAVGGDEGTLRANGSIALAPNAQWRSVLRDSRYDVTGSLDDLDLSLWVAALGFKSIPVTGRAFGTASIHGRYPLIALAGSLQLKNGTVGRMPIEDADIGLSSQGSRIIVDRSSLLAPGLSASATGSFGLRPTDPLSLDIRASSDDVPRLVATFSRTQQLNVNGTFDADVHVGGTPRVPALSASLNAKNVTLYGINVASMFGSLALRGQSLELSDAGMTFERGQAAIAGSMPLQLRTLAIGPADAPVSFDLSATGLDPSIFDGLLGEHTQLGGTIDGKLAISGIAGEPQISGQFGIKGGSYVSDLERIPVKGVVASLTFNRTSATVDEFRAKFGNGMVRGQGKIAFANGFGSGGGPTFDIALSAFGAQFDLPAYGNGTVDGKVTLARDAGQRAQLSGAMTLSSATVPFSAFAAAIGGSRTAPGPGLPFDLGFNLKMTAGKNVRVRGSGYGAGLDIAATGGATLGGTLAAPTLAGGFASSSGTLTYFDRAFKVQEARVHFNPSDGILPTIHAVGTTHVLNPDPDPARNPYGATDVTIDVDGPLDALKVGFDSSPPGYTKEQIIALIAPFGGFLNGIQFSSAAPLSAGNGLSSPGTAPLVQGVLVPQSNGTLTVGQEAFNILNAQFAAGVLSPFETALSSGLGLSGVNLTVDYYGNVGVSARRLLGKDLSAVYATSFGYPTRTSFGLALATSNSTAAQLSFFFQNGQQTLFNTLSSTISTNGRVTAGQPLVGNSGFSFTLQRLYW